jgi:putative SOS response-associated peptidase YedK
MCNDYRLLTASATLFDGFSEIKIPIRFSEGKPNLEAREDIKTTDPAPMVRAAEDESGVSELVQRRGSWPGQNGKPVYNFRSDGREFAAGRCLIPADVPMAFTSSRTPPTKGRGARTSGCSRRRANHGFALLGFGARSKTSAKRSRCSRCLPAPTSRPTTTARSPSSVAPIGPLGLIRQCQPRQS